MKIRSVILLLGLFLIVLPLLAALIGNNAFSNQAPTATFVYAPNVPMPQETVTFDASGSHDADGFITKYSWNFGEGNITIVTNAIITHAFPVDGNYTVELTVTDNGGLTGVTSAVIQVSSVVYFRVCFYGTTTPVSNVSVTVYYKSGSTWTKAPVGSHNLEITYDLQTQPGLADTHGEKYRNPGYTASILRCDASNIGFDIHPSYWKVYFKFQWGSYVAYWPDNPSTVYSYNHGTVETHNYPSGYQAFWDSAASTYVIKVNDIRGGCVNPTESHPIIVGINCPPPTQRYYLTVRTDPSGITTISGQGWYNKGENVALTAPAYVDVSSNTRYRFNYWDVDGTSQGAGVNPITVGMNANHTATAHYVFQYLVTFSQTGLTSDATGTVVTVDGSSKTLSALPFTKWVDTGSSVTYAYNSPVSSSISGKRFRLNSVTGPSSPISVSGPVTVTGCYVVQYCVTFSQTGLDSTATGTVVTVNSVPKTYADLPYSAWFDSGSSVAFSYSSIVSSSVTGQRFRLVAVHCPPSSPFTVTQPESISGEYCKQYLIAFAQSGLDATATGTVVTVNSSPKAYTDLTFNLWVDSGSSVNYLYGDTVLSTVSGKRFKLVSVTGPTSPVTVTSPTTVTGNYKIQYQILFDQTGVGSDFTGTVLTIDSTSYGRSGLPVSFWWDKDSSRSFVFGSPLVVNASKQYAWQSTSGLTSLQSGSLTITASGSVVGNYGATSCVIFDQSGVGSDFTGTVVTVDGTPYGVGSLPVSFTWNVGSIHSFSFQSPLVVMVNGEKYVWTSTTGLSTSQADSITVATFGSIIGNYKTQYYLTLATNHSGINSPSGAGWYDANTYASISTEAYVDIVPGSSRYRFYGWTTTDMAEIVSPSSASTTVLMDKAKTVTANYLVQFKVTFDQSGVGSDFTGSVVQIDAVNYGRSGLPVSFWWDGGSSHTFAFASPLVVDVSKQYDWASTTGLSTSQGATFTITGSGSVIGNYVVHGKYQITFNQSGVSSDFAGTIVVIDGVNYGFLNLPVSFWWDSGSSHNFAFASPLNVGSNKRYVWTSTTGLSTSQGDSITISGSGSVIGNYKTQYYLTLATDPSGVNSPSGSGWYDAGTYATISTDAYVDIVSGSSRYRFNGWSTGDMSEITDPTRSPTDVLMDEGKTVTANYVVQYKVTFDQTGVGSDFSGNVVTVDATGYTRSTMPFFWWDKDSGHAFAFQSPLVVTANAKQYVWNSTTGLSTSQGESITITASGSVIGNYKTQYYLTVNSAYDSPNPTSRWFYSGTSVTASVTSPASGSTGTRYVCTGWSGTGSAPGSGTSATMTFTITQASSITWNWKTQYQLSADTDPVSLSPQPTRNPTGEPGGSWWYDASTSVTLTAQTVTGYTFDHWTVDGSSKGNGVNPITVTMNAPHIAVAYYVPSTLPLSVSISPPLAAITLGDSVTFVASPTGGTSPYTYQWYLNGSPYPGATSALWAFTPSTSGTYHVYVNVTDSKGKSAVSSTSTVTVSSGGGGPVGGYSTPLVKLVPFTYAAVYFVVLALFSAALSISRRKRK